MNNCKWSPSPGRAGGFREQGIKNIFRILSLLFLLVVVLAGLFAVTMRAVFPPRQLTMMMVNGIRGFTLRDASADRVTIGWRGLQIAGLAISEFPNFKAGTFISLPHCTVTVRLLPLFRQRIVAGEAVLDSPRVEVKFRRDCSSSFDNLFSPSPGAQYLPVSLLAGGVKATNGSIALYSECGPRYALDARHVDCDVRNTSPGSPLRVRCAADIGRNGELHIDGCGSIDIRDDRITVDRLVFSSGAAMLTVTGSISHFMKKGRLFDIHAAGDRILLDRLTEILPFVSRVQFGASKTVSLSISGDAENLKIIAERSEGD